MINVEKGNFYIYGNDLIYVLDISERTTGPSIMKSMGTSCQGFPKVFSFIRLYKNKRTWYREYKYEKYCFVDKEMKKDDFIDIFLKTKYNITFLKALYIQNFDNNKITNELLNILDLN
jgi:hypothetical protein